MDVSNVTTAQSGTVQPAASAASSAATLSSDFETFLQMMTAQAQYQDPLDPMDSSDYASQLAQFSMVEQQVLTNDLLEALTGALGYANMASLSGWIGMEALSHAPVAFDGTPVTVAPSPLAAADALFLVVYDENENEVQRMSIPVSVDPYQWDGTDATGQTLPPGTYTLKLENMAEGELLLEENAQSYARIQEARIEAGETILVLDGGSAILSSDITGLREGM
ncbi:MAG: flagellar hook capping FlgD N-terminal domain-containing protein [Pseudomonadota bacterium]